MVLTRMRAPLSEGGLIRCRDTRRAGRTRERSGLFIDAVIPSILPARAIAPVSGQMILSDRNAAVGLRRYPAHACAGVCYGGNLARLHCSCAAAPSQVIHG